MGSLTALYPTQRYNLNGLKKLMLIFTGACLMGTLWRVRGEHGWGSSWGLLTVGVIFTLFIFSVFGYRKKADYFYFALTGASFMLTVPSWGTILTQITGILQDSETVPAPYAVIPVYSGIILMLCVGFGMASLFAFMLSRLFSQRCYRMRDYVIVLIVFFAVQYISKATISHYILNFIQPQAASNFSEGLKFAGDNQTVYSAYLSHFDNLAWAKKIPGGRNYFSSIQAISSALSALAVYITVRLGFKDKKTGRMTLGICLSFAAAITIADLSMWAGNGGYHMQQFTPPSIIAECAWPLWEFATGFIAGAIIMIIIVSQKGKVLDESNNLKDRFLEKTPSPVKAFLNLILVYAFALVVPVLRPVAERFSYIPNVQIIIYAAVGTIALVFGILMLIKKVPPIWNINIKNFCLIATPVFILITMLEYLFAGQYSSPVSAEIAAEPKSLVYWLMLSASAVSIILTSIYAITEFKRNKQN